jgi:hypothetical protein
MPGVNETSLNVYPARIYLVYETGISYMRA